MKPNRGPLVWGVLLVLGGLLLLAQNFGVFGRLSAPLWGVVFGAASAGFFAAFLSQRGAWWFLFPAFVFAGLSATVVIGEFGGQGQWTGSIFLWSIAAAFWGVYLTDSRQWWAVIPGGVMTTIGIMPLAADRLPGAATGAIFFIGLGLTFAVLYLLRGRHAGATAWAVFPAAGCLGMALILGVFGPLERFWPVIFLIVPGVYLLFNALRPRGAGRQGGPDSPAST